MILATPLVLRGLVTLLCYQDSTKNCFVRVWLKNVFASKNKNIKRTVIFPTLPKAIKVPWQLSFLRLFSLFGYFGFLFNYALSLFKIGFLFSGFSWVRSDFTEGSFFAICWHCYIMKIIRQFQSWKLYICDNEHMRFIGNSFAA